MITIDLLVDKPDKVGGPRRKDRNLRTGFVIEKFAVEELKSESAAQGAEGEVK